MIDETEHTTCLVSTHKHGVIRINLCTRIETCEAYLRHTADLLNPLCLCEEMTIRSAYCFTI